MNIKPQEHLNLGGKIREIKNPGLNDQEDRIITTMETNMEANMEIMEIIMAITMKTNMAPMVMDNMQITMETTRQIGIRIEMEIYFQKPNIKSLW